MLIVCSELAKGTRQGIKLVGLHGKAPRAKSKNILILHVRAGQYMPGHPARPMLDVVVVALGASAAAGIDTPA